MVIDIDGIPVYFPYAIMHPEQKSYITFLLSCFKQSGQCLLEMPSGTGKTISILSATISFHIYCKNKRITPPKILYCSRTLTEIEKALEELKSFYNYLTRENILGDFLGLGLTSRTTLCVNDNARRSNCSIEHACHSMIRNEAERRCEYFVNLEDLGGVMSYRRIHAELDAKTRREGDLRSTRTLKRKDSSYVNNSEIHHKLLDSDAVSRSCNPRPQNFDKNHSAVYQNTGTSFGTNEIFRDNKSDGQGILPEAGKALSGVYTLADLKALGLTKTLCPYYLARHYLHQADIVIFPYNYVIDPRIRNSVLKEVPKNTVVIFDEAHNIDNACIEALSVEIKRGDLDRAKKELSVLDLEIKKQRIENFKVLEDERARLRDSGMEFVDGHVPYVDLQNERKPRECDLTLTDSCAAGMVVEQDVKPCTDNIATSNAVLNGDLIKSNFFHQQSGINGINVANIHQSQPCSALTDSDMTPNRYMDSNSETHNNQRSEEKQNPSDKRNILTSATDQSCDAPEYTQSGAESFFALNYDFAPGSIRNSVHFLSVLRRCCEYLLTKLKTTHSTCESPKSFISSLSQLSLVDKRCLSFLSTRLGVLSQTLELAGRIDLPACRKICDMLSLAAQHKEGFQVLYTPFDDMASSVFAPTLRLACLDGGIALKSVLSLRCCVITSGTLSPLPLYARMLGLTNPYYKQIGIVLNRNAITPLIITKGNDQMTMRTDCDLPHNETAGTNTATIARASLKEPRNTVNVLSCHDAPQNNVLCNGMQQYSTYLSETTGASTSININYDLTETNKVSSSYSLRNDPSVIRNYGLLILELTTVVPDGMVVFFPSYIFMEELVTIWSESGLTTQIQKNKLIFIETPANDETVKALDLFKAACDKGRGAILFAIARGKVSEGVDFAGAHGRCAVLLGVPFQYTESLQLKKRMEFLENKLGVRPTEFLNFDAMRQAAQCLGRVLRNKSDYGLMIMADYRFEKSERKDKLPQWIIDCIETAHTNLSIDMAICIAKRFFREMAQPLL